MLKFGSVSESNIQLLVIPNCGMQLWAPGVGGVSTNFANSSTRHWWSLYSCCKQPDRTTRDWSSFRVDFFLFSLYGWHETYISTILLSLVTLITSCSIFFNCYVIWHIGLRSYGLVIMEESCNRFTRRIPRLQSRCPLCMVALVTMTMIEPHNVVNMPSSCSDPCSIIQVVEPVSAHYRPGKCIGPPNFGTF